MTGAGDHEDDGEWGWAILNEGLTLFAHGIGSAPPPLFSTATVV